MTREQRAWLSAALAFVILVLVADLAAWLRLGRRARQLAELRTAARGSAEGPTGDSLADLAALREQLGDQGRPGE